ACVLSQPLGNGGAGRPCHFTASCMPSTASVARVDQTVPSAALTITVAFSWFSQRGRSFQMLSPGTIGMYVVFPMVGEIDCGKPWLAPANRGLVASVVVPIAQPLSRLMTSLFTWPAATLA